MSSENSLQRQNLDAFINISQDADKSQYYKLIIYRIIKMTQDYITNERCARL